MFRKMQFFASATTTKRLWLLSATTINDCSSPLLQQLQGCWFPLMQQLQYFPTSLLLHQLMYLSVVPISYCNQKTGVLLPYNNRMMLLPSTIVTGMLSPSPTTLTELLFLSITITIKRKISPVIVTRQTSSPAYNSYQVIDTLFYNI